MHYSPRRIAGFVLSLVLALSWARPAAAQPAAVPEGFSPSTVSDEGLPWAGSTGGTMRRSGSTMRFNFVGGQGVGFDSSYMTLGLFQPFWLDTESLWYFDAQGLLIGRTFDEKNGLSGGANVGVGYRAPSPWYCNTVWGAYLFYDYSDVYRNAYNQLGVGVESLGDVWDLRSNFYFPLDKTSNLVSLSPMMGPFYRDYNMFFSQTEVTERAFWGFDAEVGKRLYGCPDGMNIRGYVGTYYYENWDIEGPQFWGIYGRVQAHLLPDVWANVTVSSDEQFDTRAWAQLTWLLPVCGKRINCISALSDCGPCNTGCGPCPPGRLVEPVRRNPNIVVRDVTRTIETIATDPLTGLPISILHVDSNAAPGGDGTFENPFNTLAATQAEAATGNYDIVFAHADSIFTNEQITLPPDVRFLGEGIDHLVDTEQAGTVLLPRATNGTDLPIIDAAPGNAIEVASGDEVSGFTITDPAAAGIFANGVAGPVNINRNTISGGVNGINILNSTGTFDVTETTIDGTSGTAFNIDGGAPIVNSSADITNNSGRIIAVQNTTGGTVTFQGGTLLDDGGEGILVNNVAGAVVVDGATLNNSVANAVDILNSSGAIDLKNIAIATPAGSGVNILNSNATISNFTIDSPGVSGIVVTSLNTNRTVTLANNTINNAGTTGIELNVNGTGRLTANVTGNTVTAVGNAFDAATSGAGGPLVLALDNNSFSSDTAAGAVINGTAGGLITITSFQNNIVPDASTGGILVDAATFDASTVVAGIQAVNGGVSTIGSAGNRVLGDGLRLNNVLGSLTYTNLEVFNDSGTGLLINGTGVGPSAFTFATTNGKLDTVNGPALVASDVNFNTATFASILSDKSSTNGIVIDNAGGTFKSTNTTVTDPTNSGLIVQNSPNLIADFGATSITGVGVDPTDFGNGVQLTNNPGAKFTFSTLNIQTDYGGGLIAVNSGTVNMLAPATITANGGPVLNLENTSGQTNGLPGWTFNSLTSTNSLTDGLRLVNLTDPFTVTGATTIDNAAQDSIEIGGTTTATFNAVTITNRQGTGILLNGTSSTIKFGVTSISGAGGVTPGVDMLNSTAGSVEFAQLAINGSGGQGIRLSNNVASFAVTGPTTINQAQGTGLEINGGTGGATFGTVTMTNRFGAGIDISGGNQNITLGATSINNPNGATGTVLNVDGTTGGKVTLASLTADVNNAAADGVTLIDNQAIVEVLGGSLSNASGTALKIDGGDADVTFAANINNSVGRSVEILDRLDGVVNINGTVTDGGSGTGIYIHNPINPNTVNFNAKVTLGSSLNRLTGGTALTIDGGSLAPDTAIVNFANLDVFTDSQVGILATNGGTLNIVMGRVDTTGVGAQGIHYDGIDTNTTLTSLSVDNTGLATDAVVLKDITGSFAVSGPTTLGATGTIGRGVSIDGGDATITFGNTTIANRDKEGIVVDQTAGTITFGTTNISGSGAGGMAGVYVHDTTAGAVNFGTITVGGTTGAGVLLDNNVANFKVTGATTINGSSSDGVKITNSSGNVDLASVNITNTAGTGLGVNNLTGALKIGSGSVTNANGTAVDIQNSLIDVTLNTVTATNGQAINLVNNTGTFNVTGTVTQNNGTGSSIHVLNGSTNVTLGSVAINNTAGMGIDVQNSAGLFKINGGSVNNTGGGAINISDTSIDVTLASVSSNNAPGDGVLLINTPGKFTASGGTIQNSGNDGFKTINAENITLSNIKFSNITNAGVFLQDTTNVSLNNLTITGVGTHAVFADQSSQLTLSNLNINSGATSNGVVMQDSNNVTITGGSYVSGLSGVSFNTVTDASITGVTINGGLAPTSIGINLFSSDNIVVRNNTLNQEAIGLYDLSGAANVTTTIEGNKFNNNTIGIVIDGTGGSVTLVSGPIADPTVNNTTTATLFPFLSFPTVNGKIVVNGVLVP